MNKIQQQEVKAMKIAIIMFAIMGITGIVVGQYANSSAILIDGVFSLISVATTIIAIKISNLLSKKDESYPFGFSGYEVLYVIARCTVLIITVSFALSDCIAKIMTYIQTGEATSVSAIIFVIYNIFIACMYLGLQRHYRKYNKTIEESSELLAAEQFNAKSNALLMLGVGASFIVISLLQYTPLNFLTPIADSIILLVIAIMVIVDSVKLLVSSIRTLGGKGITQTETEALLKDCQKVFASELNVLSLKAKKVGRTLQAEIAVSFNESSLSQAEMITKLDKLKQHILTQEPDGLVYINIQPKK